MRERILDTLAVLAIIAGALLMAYAFAGCTVAPEPVAPHVGLFVVKSDPGHTPTDGVQEHLDGARAWSPLGFDVTFEYGDYAREECGRNWHQNDTERLSCQITIGVVLVPFLVERRGTDALADREARAIYLDTRLVGEALRIATAHEVGHVVLDTPEHTNTGIMSGQTWRMSADDRDLACRAIGICI